MERVQVQGSVNPLLTPLVKPLVSSFASQYLATMYGGDFYNILRTSNGQQLLEFSEDPIALDARQSSIKSIAKFRFPASLRAGIGMSFRPRGMFFVAEATVGDDSANEPEYDLVSVVQATTTLTVTLTTPYVGYLGDWCDLYNLVDTRFNYSNLCIASISTNKKILTFTTTDDVGITSLSATAASVVGGKLKRVGDRFGSTDGVGYRFSGTTTTAVAPMVKYDGNDSKVWGALVGSHLVTCNSTAMVYVSGNTGQFEMKPTARFEFNADEDVSFNDVVIDATTLWITRVKSTEVKPNYSKDYIFRLRSCSSLARTRPIAKIKAISKSGTTTCTVTTDVPHGLTTTSVVTITGARDITNFANTTVTVASIVSPTQFTVILGSAVTAASYGGFVCLVNGGVAQQGLLTMNVQSVARDAANFVTLTGNTAWSGYVGIGELVNLHGCLDASGNDLGFDGVYRVNNVVTTTMILEPVIDTSGNRIQNGDGNNVTPTGGVLNATNCGGGIILRSTIRLSDITVESWTNSKTIIDGRGSYDIKKAIPVVLLNSAVSNQGTAAAISPSTGLGGWYIHQAIVGLPDIASAAITSTTTTSAFANNLGNGFQVNINVTAVTGTNPTLDIRVEESFDGGTNWVTLYDMQRITAIGSYNTPILRATGRHIRYVQTVTGTSPSFTRAVIRNTLPFIQAEPQKRIMDRTINLTTVDSVTPTLFQGAANNVQLILSLGTAATPPALQIEGSEDGVNFYPIGSPLTGVPSKTVQVTLITVSCTYVRARVSTVGVTVVPGYVSIKAWS